MSKARDLADFISDSTVGADEIADGAVSTAKIADGAITSAKVGSGAIGESQIADGAISAGKLASGAAVPAQAGQGGKYLTTDGTSITWGTVDTSQGDTAYGWGDHGAQGYATTTALNTATANSTNWDTAYGWGDHGAAGYAASASLGALASLNTVGSAQIDSNSVTATQLNVSGNGASGQFLKTNADGSFAWTDAPASAPTQYTQGFNASASSSQPPINYDVSDVGNQAFPIAGSTADVNYSANVSCGHNPAENTSTTVQISFDNGASYTTLANGNGKGYNLSGNTKINQNPGNKTVKLRMSGYSGQLDNNNRYRNFGMNVSINDVNIVNG